MQCLFESLQRHTVPFFSYGKKRCIPLNPLLCVHIFFLLSRWYVLLFSFPAGKIKDENCLNARLLGLNKDVILLREIRVRSLNQFATKKTVFIHFY